MNLLRDICLMIITGILSCYLAVSCAESVFNGGQKKKAAVPPTTAPSEDAEGCVGENCPTGSGDEGVNTGEDPPPGGTTPSSTETPGAKPPGDDPGAEPPGEDPTPEFALCGDGTQTNPEEYPVLAKVYQYGPQNPDFYGLDDSNSFVVDIINAIYHRNELTEYTILHHMVDELKNNADFWANKDSGDSSLPNVGSFLKNNVVTSANALNNIAPLDLSKDENYNLNEPAKLNIRSTFCMKNFDWGPKEWLGGFPIIADHGNPELEEFFVLRAASQFKVPFDGEFQFMMVTDDGGIFELYDAADGSKVYMLDTDGPHSPLSHNQDNETAASLKKGKVYNMHLRYFQGPRKQIALRLLWKQPKDSDWKIVPTEIFVHKPELIKTPPY